MNPNRNLKIVVTGFIGLLPTGGVTWDYIQYPLGFRELGCDVLYLEDTHLWPVFQDTAGEVSCAANVEYLASVMRRFGMEDRWAYRDEVTGRYFGMERDAVLRFCEAADILVNVSCSLPLREEYAAIPVRALIDTDPMFTQVQCATGKSLCGDRSALPDMVAEHTHLFTFGENIGRDGCFAPTHGRNWRPTRQPVLLRRWPEVPPPQSGAYTSVFNWTAARDFEFMGRRWGQKDVEFLRFLLMPRFASSANFTIAVGQTTGDPFPADAARNAGWEVLDAGVVARTMDSYQEFIRASRAEFSVAKHTYVQAATGWFSCRSACYLATGRPVVTQETGWTAFLPTGAGLFAFSNAQEALDAIELIEDDPVLHSKVARLIAEEYFDSNTVLSKVLSELGAT
jgi:hypothetical protein